MARKAGVAVVAVVVVVLGGIFVFAGGEHEPGGAPAAGPAPTTLLTRQAPDDPYPPVPAAQVAGPLFGVARTSGRNLYVPVGDDDCAREQVWPKGEDATRVEIEIRSLPGPSAEVTTGPDWCMTWGGRDDAYAVVELAEPLGARRLAVHR